MKDPINLITVYQTNPFNSTQGGGVRYVKNLLIGQERYCKKVLFFGIGEEEAVTQGIVTLFPITKKYTGYVWFLMKLLLSIIKMDLSDYHVVHVHRLYFALPFLLCKKHLKVLCTLHGRSFSVFEARFGKCLLGFIKPLFSVVEKFVLRRVDYLAPVSSDVVKAFAEKYPTLWRQEVQRKYSILGSMLNLNRFTVQDTNYLQNIYGKGNCYVLFIGRLAAVKDVPFLIKLWGEKFQDHSNIKLVLAGKGEDGEPLISLAKTTCKVNPPLFLGQVQYKEIPQLVSSAQVVILSSHHEASPTVVKEALSSGIPVVCNDVGDVRKFIKNGKNGFLVEKSVESYYQAIMSLFSHPIPKLKVVEESSADLGTCSTDYITAMYLELYKNLISAEGKM